MKCISEVISDIVELERINMTRILNEHGIEFNEELVMMDILDNNCELHNILLEYSSADELLGFIRFNFEGNSSIIVKSIQIRNGPFKLSTFKNLIQKSLERITELNMAGESTIYL